MKPGHLHLHLVVARLPGLLRMVGQALAEPAQQPLEVVDQHVDLPADGQLPVEGEAAEGDQIPDTGDEGLDDLLPVLAKLPAEAGTGHSVKLGEHVNDGSGGPPAPGTCPPPAGSAIQVSRTMQCSAVYCSAVQCCAVQNKMQGSAVQTFTRSQPQLPTPIPQAQGWGCGPKSGC